MSIDERPDNGHGDALLDALRVGDREAITDELVSLAARPEAERRRAVASAADRAIAELAPLDAPADTTVGALAAQLYARTGAHPLEPSELGLTADEAARSRLDAVGDADTDTLRAALRAAYAALDSLRDERHALEDQLTELAGARVLADVLAAELERDEWIRARLRKVKATPPARAAIKLRRKLRGAG